MKVSDMFPAKYVKGEHLNKSRLIEIHDVEPTELRAGPGKPAERVYLLWFEDVSSGSPVKISGVAYTPRRGHALVLRGTLAKQIVELLNADDTNDWSGKRVVIYPENAVVAGRPLTLIRARAPKQVPERAAPPTHSVAEGRETYDVSQPSSETEETEASI